MNFDIGNAIGKRQFGEASINGGFDILRLVSPNVEDVNEDFICGICKSNLPLLTNIHRDRQLTPRVF